MIQQAKNKAGPTSVAAVSDNLPAVFLGHFDFFHVLMEVFDHHDWRPSIIAAIAIAIPPRDMMGH